MMGFILSAIFIPIISLICIIWGDTGWNLNSRKDRLKCLYYAVANIIVCCLINILLYFGGTSRYRFNEILNYQIMYVEHWERWTTLESKTETYACGRDKDGNTKFCTRIVNYTQTHGPYWYSYDNVGNRRDLSKSDYEYWMSVWGNQIHIRTNRGSSSGIDRAITGKVYRSNWDNKFESIFPYSVRNTYINKVRASGSSLSRRMVNQDQRLIDMFPRPADTPNFELPIINHSDYINISTHEQMLIRRLNALLGHIYEIHNIIMLFDVSEYDQNIVQDILNIWDGTNKNELVTFIGLDKSDIKWVEVNSWTDSPEIHSILRNKIMELRTFDIDKISLILKDSIEKSWIRKSFEDFDYIKYRIHWGWIVAAYLLTILISIKSYFWINYFYK